MRAGSVVLAYYVISALTSVGTGLIMGVYSNFLRSANLDEFWVNMVNVSYFAVITLCEIPTGLFADIFGRKGSFVISCFLETISFAVYGFSKSFGGFVLAESIGAFGKTFASGAFDAWLKDSLRHSNEEYNLLKIISRRSLINKIATIESAIIGGIIADKGMNFPFFAGSIAFLICGIVAIIMMKEVYFIRSKHSFQTVMIEAKIKWKNSVNFAKNDANFRFVIFTGSIQMFAVMATNMQWQKIFSNLGLKNSVNGIIGGLINIALIIGVLLAKYIANVIRNEKMQIIFIQVVVGVCIILTVTFTNIYSIFIFFLLHEVGRGANGPIKESFAQNCITSDKERATLGSFGSMIEHFGGALGLLVSGLIAKYASIKSAWIFSGLVLVISAFVFYRNHKKERC